MATGAYLRIERDNEWVNIEIDQLTDDELDSLAKDQPGEGWVWAKFLAAWIRDTLVEAPRDTPSPGEETNG